MDFQRFKFVLLWLAVSVCVSALSTLLFAKENGSDVWWQYRGPNRDGVSNSKNLLDSWPDNGPALQWKKNIGVGFSGIVVSEDKIYTMFAEDSSEYLACYNESDAGEIWRLPVGKLFVEEFGNGPRSTPTIDGNRVFAMGSYGILYAADKLTGEEIWKVSLSEKFGSKLPLRGFSTSPIIADEKLIMDIGGGEGKAIAAMDKETGETLWTIFDGIPGYSSPIKISVNNSSQIIFRTMNRAESGLKFYNLAVSPEGEILWEKEASGLVFAMPVFIPPDKLFFSSSDENGTLLQIIPNESGGFDVQEIWSRPTLKNHFNSSVLYQDHLYGFSVATLKCIDVETGSVKWAKRGLGKGSLVLAGDKLVILSDKGKLVLAEATPEEFIEISSFQALNGKSWTMPAIVGGKVYLRNQTEMACYDLRNK